MSVYKVRAGVTFNVTLDIEAECERDALEAAFEALHNRGYVPSAPQVRNPDVMGAVKTYEVDTYGDIGETNVVGGNVADRRKRFLEGERQDGNAACARCGNRIPYGHGAYKDEDAWLCSDGCLREELDECYGKGNWREDEEMNEADGFYTALEPGVETPLSIYWTECDAEGDDE